MAAPDLSFASLTVALALQGAVSIAPALTGEFSLEPALTADSFAWTGIMFADAETPEGEVNGDNVYFELANAPNPPSSLQLFLGLIQVQGVDYVLEDGNIIVFAEPPDEDGPTPIAWYRY